MRKLFPLLLAVVLVSFFVFSVYAHSGKTDTSGGHTDYSTGDYHYHHGYSAHEHYDMDGNGTIDCPYGFTNREQANNSSYTSSLQIETYEHPTNRETVHTQDSAPEKNSSSVLVNSPATEKDEPFSGVGLLLICALAGITAILIAALDTTKKNSQENQKKYRQEIDRLDAHYKSNIESLINEQAKHTLHSEKIKKDYESQILKLSQQKAELEAECEKNKNELIIKKSILSRNRLERKLFLQYINEDAHLFITPRQKAFSEFIKIADTIPDDVYFIKGTIPVSGDVDYWNPFGDFTVYTSPNGTAYHYEQNCSSSHNLCMHIYDAVGKKKACRKCVLNPVTTIPEWYTALSKVSEFLHNT